VETQQIWIKFERTSSCHRYITQSGNGRLCAIDTFSYRSQITKIRRIKTALREAAQFYVQMHEIGFNIEFVDVGGGLGVDYDGTRSSYTENSTNYSIQEYVNDSVFSFVDAANKNNIPHPNIITESGRALTAHHSVLVFEVLETATLPEWNEEKTVQQDDHELVKELYSIGTILHKHVCSRHGMMRSKSGKNLWICLV
jgi:arginine decarboxylase-like protein